MVCSTINKHSPTVVEDKDVIGPGCKWSLSQFEAWVNQAFPNGRGQDMYQALWQRMINIINLTCLMLLSSVPTGTEACFELLGYDIIVDSDWSPILLEVNCSPAITKVSQSTAHTSQSLSPLPSRSCLPPIRIQLCWSLLFLFLP